MRSALSAVTPEMVEAFERRERKHAALVAANLLRLDGWRGLRRAELEERGRRHDASKLGEPEREGYIWLTWRYRCRALGVAFEAPDGVDEAIERAQRHHQLTNAHHPEAHARPEAMAELDLAELACDWKAVAQENGTDCAAWARENARRWSFSPTTLELIHAAIEELEPLKS